MRPEMVLKERKLRPCRHVHPNLASGQIECEQCGLNPPSPGSASGPWSHANPFRAGATRRERADLGLFLLGGRLRGNRRLLLVAGFLRALLSFFLLVVFWICIAHNPHYAVTGSADARCKIRGKNQPCLFLSRFNLPFSHLHSVLLCAPCESSPDSPRRQSGRPKPRGSGPGCPLR